MIIYILNIVSAIKKITIKELKDFIYKKTLYIKTIIDELDVLKKTVVIK